MLGVFITDLAAYNAGELIGRWVTLPIGKFELSQIILEILKEGEEITGEENHDEIFLTDYEWSFMTKEIREIDEYEDVYELNREAFLLSELGNDAPRRAKTTGSKQDTAMQPITADKGEHNVKSRRTDAA